MGKRRTYPTIQTITPTKEIMRDKKANGRPKRNPRGLNLQSSPQQQHMATTNYYFLEVLKL
jgi:hypothetical protein